MVATWRGNRRFLIGWINHRYGWGGWLCLRELIQYPDGHLGTKWIPEMPMPVEPLVIEGQSKETLAIAFHTDDPKDADFAFILDAAAGKARFAERAGDGSPSCGDAENVLAAPRHFWQNHHVHV